MRAKNEENRNATATIGTTTEVICPSREGSPTIVAARVITNTSTGGQIITLSFENEAVAGVGIVLLAGYSFQESFDGHFIPSDRKIWAISSAAGGTLGIFEKLIPEV